MAYKALNPPIESLSEHAWQRLEDAVIEHIRSRQARMPAPLQPRVALLFAAASLGISVLAAATTADNLLPYPPNTGDHQTRAEDLATDPVTQAPMQRSPHAADLHAGEHLEQPSVVTTGPAEATYQLGSSELTVAPRSKVRYHGSDADGWLVVVESGSIHCEVAPRLTQPDFVVRAGTTEVRVVGTRFDVAYQEGQASVSVDEGRVLVFDGGQHSALRAGQNWPATKATDPALNGEVHTAPRPKRGASSHSARSTFELAASLETSDPERAESVYRRLSRSGGPWAANALYAQARLLKDGGRDAEADQLLSRYLKQYPRGTNAADARRLLRKR